MNMSELFHNSNLVQRQGEFYVSTKVTEFSAVQHWLWNCFLIDWEASVGSKVSHWNQQECKGVYHINAIVDMVDFVLMFNGNDADEVPIFNLEDVDDDSVMLRINYDLPRNPNRRSLNEVYEVIVNSQMTITKVIFGPKSQENKNESSKENACS